MASAAEHLASSITFANFQKATELKKRLWFTLGGLILFRLLSFVPVPGIDPAAMSALYQTQSGGILDVFNTFSGGALQRFSIVALGVMPYITASIVVQLGATLYGPWQQLRKEGETGRKKLNQYTRYLTVAITLVQGYLAVKGLESQSLKQGIQAVVAPGLLFEVAGTVSLVGGTLFLMWIGEQITSRGIGNGVSLIIMAGIIARLPQAIAQLLEGSRTGSISGLLVVGIVVLTVVLVLFICFMERAQRRVLIQYPKRQTVRGMQQERSHLPIKLNTAGVIPPIFASSLLLMPLTVLNWAGSRAAAERRRERLADHDQHFPQPHAPAYMALYADRHRLLLLLLHGGAVQQRGDGGQSEAPRRLHPRHPPGQGDRRIFRLCAQPDHGRRRSLSGGDLPHPADPVGAGGAQHPARRHEPSDRRQRDDGHGEPNPEPPDRAPIWRPHQEGEAQDHAAAALIVFGDRERAPRC